MQGADLIPEVTSCGDSPDQPSPDELTARPESPGTSTEPSRALDSLLRVRHLAREAMPRLAVVCFMAAALLVGGLADRLDNGARGAPAAPAVVAVTRVAAGQIMVAFLPGASHGTPLMSYTATCRSTNGQVTNSGTHMGSMPAPITVTGLTVGKTYTCEVTARNERGVSVPSDPSGAVAA